MLTRCLVFISVLNFVPISFPITPGRSKKCYDVKRDRSKRIAGVGPPQRVLEPLEVDGLFNFQLPIGVGHPVS